MNIDTIIVESSEPVRLDRYLKRLFPLATQGIIESCLRKNKVKVNGKKAKSSDRIISADTLEIISGVLDSYKKLESKSNFSPSLISLANKISSQYLLQANDNYIIINKPHGIAVQGGTKIDLSIDDALSYLNYEQGTNYKLVHRLDKDTSGVLIIANGYINASKLTKAFQDKLIQKKYIAVLSGVLNTTEGVVANNLAKNKSGIYELVQQCQHGKYAETSYTILATNNHVSLVEFQPSTGRMHQLRSHSKTLGCPIVGDSKYGGLHYKRMLLHAKQLIIPAIIFGTEIRIDSDLPSEFNINLF
ncbi:MAG: RluA family pseudouridine synthase [Rickettsiaceae bacterium]